MKVKRPNAVIYFIVYILVYPFLKLLFRLKVEREGFDAPKGAHIVLANHNTMIDFLLVMLAFYPIRLNAIVAHKFFLVKPLHKFLPMMGCIPKNMFDPDIKSIIGIKTVLKRGDGILIFPEGRCSNSGAYVGINKATGKLVKKLKVPVISSYIEGAYICNPYWRKRFRRGLIRVTFKSLITVDEAMALSVDEINAAIDARLRGAEGALPIIKPFRTFSKKKLAEGLHQILYWCPKCNSEYTLETCGNEIRCNACGNTVVMDCYAKLKCDGEDAFPDTVQAWYREQVRHEMASLSENMESITENVTIRTPSESGGSGLSVSGKGVMKLDTAGWHFDGEISGEQASLFFPIETIPAMSCDYDNNFQIYSNGKYYNFSPEDRRKCLKYAILTECMHRKFSPILQTTPGDAGYSSE